MNTSPGLEVTESWAIASEIDISAESQAKVSEVAEVNSTSKLVVKNVELIMLKWRKRRMMMMMMTMMMTIKPLQPKH